MTDSGMKMGHVSFAISIVSFLFAAAALIVALSSRPDVARPDRTPSPVEITRVLSRGGTMDFYGVRLRLLRVEENDPLDPDDDSAELRMVTEDMSGMYAVREFDAIFFGGYELAVERVSPSLSLQDSQGRTRRGEGTAEITIRLLKEFELPPTPRPIG